VQLELEDRPRGGNGGGGVHRGSSQGRGRKSRRIGGILPSRPPSVGGPR
jgi:hypothetical protein